MLASFLPECYSLPSSNELKEFQVYLWKANCMLGKLLNVMVILSHDSVDQLMWSNWGRLTKSKFWDYFGHFYIEEQK
jgi:hypothetical protein